MYGDRHDFRNFKVHHQTYADGTVVAHLDCELWLLPAGAIDLPENWQYHGYFNVHTHKVSDVSISWGFTGRTRTARKP